MIISNFNEKSQYVQEDFWDVQEVQEFWYYGAVIQSLR